MRNDSIKIDFVITWVDGDDEAWLQERAHYNPAKGADAGVSRYRDWENLQFWFRGVEKFTPWVNNIYFVTWGHLPAWLNTNHPKLKIIKHSDFMNREYLPTFNINSIELNLHRIPGLSEQFVFFNDDMFLLQPMEPKEFFKNNLPRDCCIETALAQDNIENPFAHILMNDAALVNMHYNKRQVICSNFKKWFHPSYGKMLFRNILMFPYKEFSSFKYTHLPSAFLKSTYERVWTEAGNTLDSVCRNRFRTVFDLNQYIMKYWQYMEGQYEPQSPEIGRFFTLGKNDEEIHRCIRNQSFKMICINDSTEFTDFVEKKAAIIQSFEKVFPEKSAFEI